MTTIRFDSTIDDWVATLEYHMRRTGVAERAVRARQRNWFLSSVIGISLLGLVGYVTATDPSTAPIRAALYAGVMAMFCIAWGVMTATRSAALRSLRTAARKMLLRQQRDGIFAPGSVHIDVQPRELITTQNGQSITFSWSQCRSIEHLDDAVGLWFDQQGAVRVPNRAFHDESERSGFLRVVRQRAAEHAA